MTDTDILINSRSGCAGAMPVSNPWPFGIKAYDLGGQHGSVCPLEH